MAADRVHRVDCGLRTGWVGAPAVYDGGVGVAVWDTEFAALVSYWPICDR